MIDQVSVACVRYVPFLSLASPGLLSAGSGINKKVRMRLAYMFVSDNIGKPASEKDRKNSGKSHGQPDIR